MSRCRWCNSQMTDPPIHTCEQAYQAGRADGVREALEEAARIAETLVGGFTANIRVDEQEQELIRDPNGPWVLNSDVAAAIRAHARGLP